MQRFKVIYATAKNGILGKDNSIPWMGKHLEDMRYFKKLTSFSPLPKLNNIIIMGRKTWESLPKKLDNRISIVISSTLDQERYNDIFIANSFNNALKIANEIPHNDIWVIGGASIYNLAFNDYRCGEIYHTLIDKDYEGDTKLILPKTTDVVSNYKLDECEFRRLSLNNEFEYLRLLSKILNEGEYRKTRNANTWSLFNEKLEFDLQGGNNFPLLTTKRMFWKGIVEELLFFIRGDTNSKHLEEKGVNIWKGNTSQEFIDKLGLPYKEGDMGRMYGWNWRHFGAEYVDCETDYSGKGYDQFRKVIEEIKTSPTSRRILMSDFDPSKAHEGVLYPCHSLILQFYVREGNLLDIKMYQRSIDSFLGLSFNIASTSLLLCIIAKLTNKIPGRVTLTLGDCHIYENHYEQVNRQLKRLPYDFPKVVIPDFKTIKEVEDSVYEDYELEDYVYHRGIKAEMVA